MLLSEDSNIKLIDFGLVAEPNVSAQVLLIFFNMMRNQKICPPVHYGPLDYMLWLTIICSSRYALGPYNMYFILCTM